ncbi:hypothetical protein ACOMHN_035454 [Nucella lapillus]
MFTASRLGRRPKRLKEVGGADGGGGSRSHGGNVPIAPYPSQQDLYKMRMAELQKILHNNGTFKEELMQAFLTAAKASFQEHSKSGAGSSTAGEGQSKSQIATATTTQQLLSIASGGLGGLNQNLVSMASCIPTTSEASAIASTVDGGGLEVGVDSPSSLHSSGGSLIDINNFAGLDSFLFDQGTPSTPGGGGSSSQGAGMEMVSELQAANSPFSLSNVSLDPVSSASTLLTDMGIMSPLTVISPSTTTTATATAGFASEILAPNGMNDLLNQNVPGTSPSPLQQSQAVLQQFQQYQLLQQQQQQQQAAAVSSGMAVDGRGGVQVKTEPLSSCGFAASQSFVKTEPISPDPQLQPLVQSVASTSAASSPYPMAMTPTQPKYESKLFSKPIKSDINVAAIMDEVRMTPSETRRLLIEQVTDAVVEAHLTTTCNTFQAIDEANRKLGFTSSRDLIPDLSRLNLNPDDIWQKFMIAMVPEITRVVRFCKKLPGFSEVGQDDQIVLIKQGAFEVMMTRFSLLVDHENQTMMDPTLSVRSPREVIRALPMGEFLDEFFFVASQFNPLKLTDGEVGLFTSILIICPGRKGLKNVRAVGKIQSLFQQALYFLMKHNHSDPDLKFSQLMSLISTFHRINEEHFRALNNIRMYPNKDLDRQFPDIHREIFDRDLAPKEEDDDDG